jgi:protoporphyrinogen oxidase
MSRWIVGGGMTGLAAGLASGFSVLERLDQPGGICASYERDGYHFEIGGGHWIFGGDPVTTRLIGCASEVRSYRRRSAVLFLGTQDRTRDLRHVMVPYPIQDNLFALPKEIRDAALAEILDGGTVDANGTMAGWLRQQFGETLDDIFFAPFHDRYTAGLFREIAPQDGYKTPIDKARVRQGAERENSDAGYNATFLYPARGLDAVSRWLSDRCDITFGQGVVRIDTGDRSLHLSNGQVRPFDSIVATAPLNVTVEMAGLAGRAGPPDPHTSVMVLNLGVTLPNTPLARNGNHWLYTPDSRSGFHRVGYYSNVDPLFLPAGRQNDPSLASLYIETAFRGGHRPSAEATQTLVASIISELQQNGLIDKVETADPTWIDVAYTWKRPGSDWVARATALCQAYGVEPAGRFGRWSFQGISASLKEGLLLGSVLRHTPESANADYVASASRPRA